MKKKIAMLLLMSTLALNLVACGDQVDSDSEGTPEPTIEAPTEPTVEPSSSPTEEPTQELDSEPTEEPADESVPEGLEGLPEDRAWIDDLYEKLIAYDVEGVLAILHDPDFENKIEPYVYPEFSDWDDEAGYKLYTTDYKMVGIVMQHLYNDQPDKFAFYSEQEDQGFEGIGYGEILIGFENINGQDKLLCCDGETAIYGAAGETYKLTEADDTIFPWQK